MTAKKLLHVAAVGCAWWASYAQAQPAPERRVRSQRDAKDQADIRGQSEAREQIWRVCRTLDRAVSTATRQTYVWAFTPERGQGIVIPGYGAVFVLSPRILVTQEDQRVRNLLRKRIRVSPSTEGVLDSIEAQLAERHKEMAEADRALARAMAQLERAVRLGAGAAAPAARIAIPPAAPAAADPVGTPAPESAPDTPSAPPAQAPPVSPMPVPAVPGALVRGEIAVRVGEASGPPPWTVWFADEDEDDRSPELVIGDVRKTVLRVLTAEASSLNLVRPDEHLVVAVNFVPEGLFEADSRPIRTLVVRARKKDLVERFGGRITDEELAKRAEVLEY